MTRKGITPVIATSLLILIAVSAVTTSAVFLRDTTSDITDSVNDKLSEGKMREGSSINVEHAYNNSDSDISVIVRNTGKYTLAIEKNDKKKWNLYNDGKPQQFDYESYSDPSRVVLNPQETITIDTNIDYPTTSTPVSLEFRGPYGINAGLICVNSGGEESC